MSDDGYYLDSDDEFEDMLWNADPGPNLADDLAQHAGYSPVWQENPIGELEQYHSDWEYYSDDYFDDDPAILRDNPLEGSPIQKRKSSRSQPTQKGRKRKLSEIYQPTDLSDRENKLLKDSLQGTVWAKDVISAVKIFQGGQQDKVALLTDWRDKFRLTNSKSSPAPAQLQKDESWANDLGLEDMGLTTGKEPAATQTDSMEVDALYTDVDDVDVDVDVDVDDENGQQSGLASLSGDLADPVNGDEGSIPSESSSQHKQHPGNSASSAPANSDTSITSKRGDTKDSEVAGIRKKQKISDSATSSLPPPRLANSTSSKRTRSSKRLSEQTSVEDNSSINVQITTVKSSKKRKLSVTEDESSDIAAISTKRRANTASADHGGQNNNSESENPSAPQPRSTRSRARKK